MEDINVIVKAFMEPFQVRLLFIVLNSTHIQKCLSLNVVVYVLLVSSPLTIV